MEIVFADDFEEVVSENAIPIRDYIKSEFIQFVNRKKGYTYIVDKDEE